jgi:predicted tellurium resistance membrane protein TerC
VVPGDQYAARQPIFLVIAGRQGGPRGAFHDAFFLAPILIEISDLVFAVVSPVVFAITSNVLAILGLREVFFVPAAVLHPFHYLA